MSAKDSAREWLKGSLSLNPKITEAKEIITTLLAELEEKDAKLELAYQIVQSPMNDYSERPQDEGIFISRIKNVCHSSRLKSQQLSEKDAEIAALTDCLNGSSKAVYTAEVFDKQMDTATRAVYEKCIEIINSNHGYDMNTPNIIAAIRKEMESL